MHCVYLAVALTSVSQKLPQVLSGVSATLGVLMRVTLMSFSSKGLDDLLCEIQRFFWLTAVLSSLLYWGYSFGGGKC